MIMAMNRTRRVKIVAVVLVIAVAVLALEQAVVRVSSFGLDDSDYWAAVAAREAGRVEEQVADKARAEGWKIDLMQYHHEQSPYGTPNLSLEDRVSIAVRSSLERTALFNSQITRQSTSSGFSNKDVFSSPVFSNQGSYLMQFELGTPARKFVVIADTGSDLVWIQCTPCSQCYSQPDAYFNPSQSSTYSTTSCSDSLCSELSRHSCSPNCQYAYGYGDQSSTQGAFSRETVTLTSTSGGSQSFSSFGFGCGTQNQGTFSGTDGLVGLGQGPLSLVSQLGGQFGNVFSYCLVSFYDSTSTTSNLLLGSPGGSVSYTPLVTNYANPSFYYVNLVGILVGGSPLSIPAGTFSIDSSGNGGFILDSGTTITQLQNGAYVPLVNTMEALMAYPRVDGSSIGFDLCYDFSGYSRVQVPDVTFQFQNVNVDLPANNIFLQVDNAGVFCLAFQDSGFGFGIFGNVQQQNFNIAHDRANRQIGFAAKTC